MQRAFCLLILIVFFGCQPMVEQQLTTISFDELTNRTFATVPHLLNENTFSVIEHVGTQETKLSNIRVVSEQDRCTLNSIVFSDSYDDIAFLPAANKFLGFKTPDSNSNEVSWLTAAGSEQTVERQHVSTSRLRARLQN